MTFSENTAPQEFWQLGPVADIPSLLQPVAHALLQVRAELQALGPEIDESRLWDKPGGLAAAGFHLLHMTGVLDRLFTYAKGESLNAAQLDYLKSENENESITLALLLENFSNQVDRALGQLAQTDPATLTESRFAGRKKIATTQLGLLFHAAEHLMRHFGQLLVTVKGCPRRKN